MVATFGGDLEIIRLASKNGIIVRGGLSKLITYAERSLNPERIMTYVDLCLGDGKGYLNAGFELIEITKPGYFYYKNNTILSRQQCQKHKLSKLLEKFDENLSESINMFNNGFRRVWNAGNLKLIKS